MQGLTRRELLGNAGKAGAVGTAGAASLFSGCVEDVVGSGDLKIGVLQPYRGAAAGWGKISTWSFVTGLANWYDEDTIYIENPSGAGSVTFEVEDRSYELIIRNSMFDPSMAEGAAESLVLDDQVDILFGVIDTPSVIRVIEQVVNPTDTFYITGGTGSMQVTSNPDLCGRNVFSLNEHVGMEARALGTYIGEETDTETFYLLGPDTVYGRTFARTYRQALEENGVEVVGERFVPSGFSEFRGILEDIDSQADGFGVGFGARTLLEFLDVYVKGSVSGAFDLEIYAPLPGQLGMSLVGELLESTLDDITEESIEEVNIGGLASRYHWNQYDNPVNDEFVSAIEENYETLPALQAGGTYTAGSALAQAVEASGSLNPDDIAEQMHGMTVEQTPKGEGGYAFQEHNNQAKSEMTIANVVPNEEENWDASIMPSEPLARISADDVMPSQDDPEIECNLTRTQN
ncbi:MAG: ABC transporter substrate-binding protein [Halobacteriales archaeon]|nr:ABC transporter substrate-binding protein [Halobacteriales archaeon]